MIYGYLRVSSDDQDVNSQRQGVEQFAKEHGWEIEKYITDEGVSGGKDPDKRNLGPMLKMINKDDIIICSEISRLGRDLYMVMDILHYCMDKECKIYTVKDNFILGDDIQSKVLAFAFGLSAEIERQMIRQRTKEGLRLRMKMGVLLGRPIGRRSTDGPVLRKMEAEKDNIINAYKYGAPCRQIAKAIGIDRNTLYRYMVEWGLKLPSQEYDAYTLAEKRRKREMYAKYKDGPYLVVDLPRDKIIDMILSDMTIPEIAQRLPQYTYEQIYDSISVDEEFNQLYRKHGQLKIKKVKKNTNSPV